MATEVCGGGGRAAGEVVLRHPFRASPAFFFFLFFRSTPAAYGGSWVELELQLLACTTAIATRNLSPICDLCQILGPLNKARH